MERVTEQLNKDALQVLLNLQEDQNNSVIQLGQLNYKKHKLEVELSKLNDAIADFNEKIDTSIEFLNAKLKELDATYPDGVIDLEQGTVTYNK